MSESQSKTIEEAFLQCLIDCEQLYSSAARQWAERRAESDSDSARTILELMEDLGKGLVTKIYATVAQADRRWSREEARLAAILFEKLWGQRLSGDALRDATLQIYQQGSRLRWYSVVRPFGQVEVLRERIDELETVASRLANLIIKCDGTVTDSEAALLSDMEAEIRSHLRPLTLADSDEDEAADPSSAYQLKELGDHATDQKSDRRSAVSQNRKPHIDNRPAAQRLDEALNDLNNLVGLAGIKREVTTLANVLKLERQRAAAGLPATELSLHMVFTGNPGTGKTSVARIIGRIFGAMGILPSGHLVETDRSGLIAQYAGQTGPKTNKKIDEAIGGVLFIDEAYSLMPESGEDAYGQEAIQTLLKRMEDDRHRLVVILAGYPEPMKALLRSNPGLLSRFSTTLAFEDYRPSELGRIFQSLCNKSRYHVPGPTQAKLLVGFRWLYERRDKYFGNGRTARNIFEQAIRRLANRIADVAPVTTELLTTLQPEDIEMSDVPEEELRKASDALQRFLVACPGCPGQSRVSASLLGQAVQCKSCQCRFRCDWGEPVA